MRMILLTACALSFVAGAGLVLILGDEPVLGFLNRYVASETND